MENNTKRFTYYMMAVSMILALATPAFAGSLVPAPIQAPPAVNSGFGVQGFANVAPAALADEISVNVPKAVVTIVPDDSAANDVARIAPAAGNAKDTPVR